MAISPSLNALTVQFIIEPVTNVLTSIGVKMGTFAISLAIAPLAFCVIL